ncbi:MAG: hypothetical protein LUG44_08170 [Clostridiales bacterium]|nr:hypothetical protein [Clostridiales bacterium]
MTKYQEIAASMPVEDRPIPQKEISGLGDFLGIYGGEHIAATEFAIGASLLTLGVKATDIFIGLFFGNILATLTYALICAPIGVDTRLTLYSYLKKVMGPYMQKIYNVIWGIASIAMAASMLSVSASALREIFGVDLQTEWYPTDIKYVLIVLVLGIVVTLVAANGFNAVAKFSSVCIPWMIIVFAGGFFVVIPQLVQATGSESIHSIGDFLALMNNSVFTGEVVEGGSKLTVFHVAGWAWMCNLAYHGGLNDMAMFRYAKTWKYGFITAYGMYLGHFFAWASAGIMGATAAILLNQSLLVLDSGAITNAVFGWVGLLAVVVAGWTTANPNIYRASLAYQTIFTKLDIKKLTYIIGAVATFVAFFPAASNIMSIVNMIALVVPAVGAMVIAEHWILPKIGGTRYWATFKGWKLNYAGLITWAVCLIYVAIMEVTGALHSYFLWLPEYIMAIVLYLILACAMGARNDYSEQAEEDRKVTEALAELAENERNEVPDKVPNHPGARKVCAWISYAILAVFAILTLAVFFGAATVEFYKTYAMVLTILYFVFGALKTVFAYADVSVKTATV